MSTQPNIRVLEKSGLRVVLIDDSRLNLSDLERVVRSALKDPIIDKFTTPSKALNHIRAYTNEISLIITDYRMPGMQGDELAAGARFQQTGVQYDIPILVITAEEGESIQHDILKAGANDLIRRPYNEQVLRDKIRNLALLRGYGSRGDVESHLQPERIGYEDLICRLIWIKRPYPDSAIRRTSGLAKALCGHLGGTKTEQCQAQSLVKLCDIGKIGLSQWVHDIEEEEDDLAFSDRAILRSHVEMGREILRRSNLGYLQEMAEPLLHHHEQWDGSGYPQELRGEQIPRLSRIVRLVLDFDRYFEQHNGESPLAQAIEESLGDIREQSGTRFDPTMVQAMFNIREEILALYKTE